MNMPENWTIMPERKVILKKPPSVARPENAPTKNVRKICRLPTQAIEDGDFPKAASIVCLE